MILAFKNLFVELLNRNDLTKWMKFIVSVMIERCKENKTILLLKDN